MVLLAVCISERHQLSQQEGVLEHPLHGFDQIRLQGGGVLLGVVPRIQELFEGLICLCFKRENTGAGMSADQKSKLFISVLPLRLNKAWIGVEGAVTPPPAQGAAGNSSDEKCSVFFPDRYLTLKGTPEHIFCELEVPQSLQRGSLQH